MQTFLPYPSFVESARALDDKRLANQVNEAAVIYAALKGAKAWRWHPATRMWRTYEPALLVYRTACIGECIRRGIERDWRVLPGTFELFARVKAHPNMRHLLEPAEVERIQSEIETPPSLGWGPFHEAHRAALVNKDRAHYEPLFGGHEWRGYLWPVADHSYLPVARRARGPRAEARACGLFNAHHYIGARVEIWPGRSRRLLFQGDSIALEPTDGPGLIGRTKTGAYVPWDGWPLVEVDVPGRPQTFYSLTHVRVLDVDLDKVPYKMPKGPT